MRAAPTQDIVVGEGLEDLLGAVMFLTLASVWAFSVT